MLFKKRLKIIGLILVLAILLLGGGVKANTETSGICTAEEDTFSGGLFNTDDEPGDTLTGTYKNIKFVFEVIDEDSETSGAGTLSIKSVEILDSSVSEIDIPRRVEYKKGAIKFAYSVTTITSTSFSSNSGSVLGNNISVLTIPETITHIQTGIPNVPINWFSYVYLKSINVNEANPTYKSIDGVLFNKEGTILIKYPEQKDSKEYVIPDGVKTIWGRAFEFVLNLKKIIVPQSVESINALAFHESVISEIEFAKNGNLKTIGKYAFYDSALEKIELPDTVTEIGQQAFYRNRLLKTVSIPNGVKEIPEQAFDKCMQLTKVTLGDNIEKINAKAFADCSKLIQINFPDKLTYIGNSAFINCKSLDKALINGNGLEIGTEAFKNCEKLTDVKLPNNLKIINNYAFSECKSLKEISIPNSTELGEGVFAGCISLKTINLPNNLVTIPNSAFSGCLSLQDIQLPNTLVNIGEGAFSKCLALKTIVLPQSVKEIGKGAFLNRYYDDRGYASEQPVCTHENNGYDYCPDCTRAESLDKDYHPLVVYCHADIENLVASRAPAYIIWEERTEDQSSQGIALTKFVNINNMNPIKNLDLLDYIYGKPVILISGFKNNAFLTNIDLPKGLIRIEDQAFSGCTGITRIIIPKSVNSIGSEAFSECSNLQKIVIRKNSALSKINKDCFAKCNENLIIYYYGEEVVRNVLNTYNNENSKINIIIDNINPSMTKFFTQNGINAKIEISNIEDSHSGLYRYAITSKADENEIDEEEWIDLESDNIEYIADKNQTVYIYISDLVGNVNKYDVKITTIDETAPKILINELTQKYMNGFLILEVPVSDEEGGSGLKGYTIISKNELSDNEFNEEELESIKWEPINPALGAVRDTSSIKENGSYYLVVADNNNNYAIEEINITIIDKEAPEIALTSEYILEKGNKVGALVTATIKDTKSGLEEYCIDKNESTDNTTKWIKIGEDRFSTWKEENKFDEANISKYEILEDGTYYLHVKDKSNNVKTQKIGAFTGIIDVLAPKIEFVLKEESKDNTVKVKISDTTGIKLEGLEIKYAWSKDAKVAPTEFKAYTLEEKDLTKDENEVIKLITLSIDAKDLEENLLTGEYYLWLNITNLQDTVTPEPNKQENGNLVSPNAYLFDNTKPKIENYEIDNKVIKENSKAIYTIKFDEVVTEDATKQLKLAKTDGSDYTAKEIKLEKIENTQNTWKVTVTAGEGNEDIELVIPAGKFKDLVGNEIEEAKIDGVKIDNTAPNLESVTKIKKSSSTPNVENYNIKGIVEENGLDSYAILEEKDKNKITNWIPLTEGEKENKELNISIQSDNIQYIFVRDVAGNISNAYEIKAESIKDVKNPTIINVSLNKKAINKDGQAIYTVQFSEIVKLSNAESRGDLKLIIGEQQIVIPVDNVKNDLSGAQGIAWNITTPKGIENQGEAKLLIPEGYFVDLADNKLEQYEAQEKLIIDNTKPELLQTYYIINKDGTITVKLVADKALFKSDGWEISKSIIDDDTLIKTFSISELQNLTKITIKDIAGNETDVTDNIKYYLQIEDKDKPQNASDPKVLLRAEKNAVNIKEKVKLFPIIIGLEKIESQGIIKWTSNDQKVATVDENGVVTAVGEGTAIITAKIAGTEIYGTYSLTVKKIEVTSVEIDKDKIKLANINDTEQLTAKVLPSNATYNDVTWASSDTSIATVDKDGKVTAVGKGRAKITVTTMSEARTDTCEVIVGYSIETRKAISLKIGSTFNLNIESVYPTGEKIPEVKWSSKDEKIADVNEGTGIVTGIAKGTTIITATTEDGYTAQCTVTVYAEEEIRVSNITLQETTLSLKEGERKGITSIITPDNATNKTINWTTDKGNVATVDGNGVVTAVGEGTATITATTVDGGHTAKCIVTVARTEDPVVAVTGVKIYKDGEEITEGKTLEITLNKSISLSAVVEPANATNKTINWTTDKGNVATVDGNGVVTAVGEGTATITATTVDGGHTAKCIVTVAREKDPVVSSEIYEIDETNFYITKVVPKTTIRDFLSKVKVENGRATLLSEEDEKNYDTKNIATGQEIEIKNNNGDTVKKYKVVVLGDVDRNGDSDIMDIFKINKHRLEKELLTGEELKAADVKKDGSIDILDIFEINKTYRLKNI